MSYYKTCPHCGAHLDPGEKCDCQRGTAVCPLFYCRWDHGEEHSLLCAREDGRVTQARTFVSAGARDAYYREKCCGSFQACPLHRMAAAARRGEKAPAAEIWKRLAPLAGSAAQEGR